MNPRYTAFSAPDRGRRDRRHHEGADLQARGAHAQRVRGRLVLADREQLQAQARVVEPPGGKDHHQRQPHQRVVHRAQVAQRHQVQAGAALGDGVEAQHEGLQHPRQAEHANRKVGALEPQHRGAQRQCQGDTGQRGDGDREVPGHAGLLDQQRADVAAQPEEADLAEMGIPGVAANQVPGVGQDCEHQQLDGEGHRVFGSEKRHGHGGNAEQHDEGDRFAHVRAPTPSSPRGRTSSTASISRNSSAEPMIAPVK